MSAGADAQGGGAIPGLKEWLARARRARGANLRERCAVSLLIIAEIALFLISSRFLTDRPMASRPILPLVALEVIAGFAWLAAVWPFGNRFQSKMSPGWWVAAGALLRVAVLFSTPILEDDYWRYLWDGSVTASGQNPYALAPQVFTAENTGGAVTTRINHPELRTIYPPIAQAAFAWAYWISPWNLSAWRGILLFFDLASLLLLLRLLRLLGLPSDRAAIYWLNPLLLNFGLNAAHMDILALPFVLGALLLAHHWKYEWGVTTLACAAGIKVWPVLLIPFLLRPLLGSPRRLLVSVVSTAFVILALSWPVVRGGLDSNSGFTAYAGHWEMNDALFMALLAGIRAVSALAGADTLAPFIARVVSASLVIAGTILLAWRPLADGRDLARRMLLAVAILFLFSPTQYPWYALWLLPLLSVQPRLSLMLLTMLLPLYHLRFYLDARGLAAVFDQGVVWVEHLPVWAVIFWEVCRGRRNAGRAVA